MEDAIIIISDKSYYNWLWTDYITLAERFLGHYCLERFISVGYVKCFYSF